MKLMLFFSEASCLLKRQFKSSVDKLPDGNLLIEANSEPTANKLGTLIAGWYFATAIKRNPRLGIAIHFKLREWVTDPSLFLRSLLS